MAMNYRVLYQGRIIALAYISTDPTFRNYVIVSVVPLVRKGKWEDGLRDIKAMFPRHAIFPNSKPKVKAVAEVLAQADIDPRKVQLKVVKR